MSAVLAGVAIGGAALSALGGAMGFRSSRKAETEARRAAREQASLTYDTRMEQKRRVERGQQQIMSQGKAKAHASGIHVTPESSTSQYLDEMQAEFTRQLDWMQEAAEREKRSIEKGYPTTGGAQMSAIAGALGGMARSYGLWRGA